MNRSRTIIDHARPAPRLGGEPGRPLFVWLSLIWPLAACPLGLILLDARGEEAWHGVSSLPSLASSGDFVVVVAVTAILCLGSMVWLGVSLISCSRVMSVGRVEVGALLLLWIVGRLIVTVLGLWLAIDVIGSFVANAPP